MRKISLFMNITINGYFEGKDHDISFFKGDDSDNTLFRETSGEVSTILLGRKTYELMKSFWPTENAAAANPEVARFMNEKEKLVASHNNFEPGWNNASVITGDIPSEIRDIKQGKGGQIVILGSNQLSTSLMQKNLIDEYQLLVNPVVLGTGTSLFTGLPFQKNLNLVKTREYKSGSVLLTYTF